MTTKCLHLECVYNDREDESMCRYAMINGGIKIDDRGKCSHVALDKPYNDEQFNIRLGIRTNSSMLAARNYENAISTYEGELRRIMHGETATKVLNEAARVKLRRMGILEMKGRRNFVSPRAQIRMLLEWEEKVKI